MRLALTAVALLGCALSYVAAEPGNNLRVEWWSRNQVFSQPPGPYNMTTITRDAVMKCAEDWVAAKVPYCQCSGGPATECCGSCPHCDKYRCDCSGFVSYCWGLPYGYVTSTLPQVSHEISKDDLQPGDVMLNTAEHVAFFAGWADSTKSKFYAIQEPGCHTTGPHYAFKSVVPYPFDFDPTLFKPYRYNNIA